MNRFQGPGSRFLVRRPENELNDAQNQDPGTWTWELQ